MHISLTQLDEKLNFKQKKMFLLKFFKRTPKAIKGICHVKAVQNLTNEKHFLKIIRQWEFVCSLFIKLLKIVVACDFTLSSFKLKRGILPPLAKCKISHICRCDLKFSFFMSSLQVKREWVALSIIFTSTFQFLKDSLYDNNFYPISFGSLNINSGACIDFSTTCREIYNQVF